MTTLRLLWISARPWDWIKNLFLFAGLFFSQSLLNPLLSLRAFAAFVLFCLISSGVYLLNDLRDREDDRQHPRKRQRPIAAGRLTPVTVLITATALLLLALGGAYWLDRAVFVIIVGYLALNLAYSTSLKHVVIIDVFCLAAGFMLRVIAGAVVIDVMISHWLLVCTMLLALFLGFGKRRHELATLLSQPSLHRRVLAEYDPVLLDIMIGVVTAGAVISYTLYTISDDTVRKFQTDKLILTVPFVLYGVFRYLYLVYRRQAGENPARLLLTDSPLLASVFLWSLVAGVILYWAKPS